MYSRVEIKDSNITADVITSNILTTMTLNVDGNVTIEEDVCIEGVLFVDEILEKTGNSGGGQSCK